MKLHERDFLAAERYQAAALWDFPGLSADQLASIREKAKAYHRWYRAHPRVHNAISLGVLGFLFSLNLYGALGLAALLPFDIHSIRGAIESGITCGALYGFSICSIVTFTVHEGAAHNLIIQGSGPVAGVLRKLANNACRLFLADPVFYAHGHHAHHRSFGTRDDLSFTNFVRFGRLLGALAPMAPIFSWSDFFPWRPQEHTRSRRLSTLLTNAYLALVGILAFRRFGPVFAITTLLVVGSWSSYALDRLRESTEHLFMPLDASNGTRSLGLGFWGLLLGGGPWGQPCHLSHHLAPALPWYQQLGLHLSLRRILTDAQKQRFFLRPVVGLPMLLVQLALAPARVEPPAESLVESP